ncbi:MAG: hypothetical protein HQL68_10340 [Magnetococcales bacterium]|nr:hypothetical protein [Magnetococcales bacterium]
MRRVKEWRKEHPGYWRKKDALQDSLNVEHMENKEKNSNKVSPEPPDFLPFYTCSRKRPE